MSHRELAELAQMLFDQSLRSEAMVMKASRALLAMRVDVAQDVLDVVCLVQGEILRHQHSVRESSYA